MQDKLLRAEMALKGMKQNDLAKAIGISRSAMSAKVNGLRPFDTDEVVKICEALEINDNTKKVDIFLR